MICDTCKENQKDGRGVSYCSITGKDIVPLEKGETCKHFEKRAKK